MSAYIEGLRHIADDYDHFILDIFGVLHDGIRPFPEAVATLQALKDAGKQTCLLSNSPRLADGAAGQMEDMGITRDLYDHILTSGEATHNFLKDNLPPHPSLSPKGRGQRNLKPEAFSAVGEGRKCWFIGNHIVAEVFTGLAIDLLDTPKGASFILNSIPGTAPPQRAAFIGNLETALEKDLPMICSNPDLVVHIGDDLYECAGTFAKIYEDMGGRVLYHGKPHAPVYERCHALLGHPEKSRLCAIGDSLHTDIAGANGFGIDGILNLAGIHREEITPEALERLNDQPHQPRYVVNGFMW